MEKNHTPGPWEHRLSDDEDACAHEIMGAWEKGARRWVGGAETLEDARLIASAPELLEAAMQAECSCSLKERDSGHLLECWMPRLQAAIAKATGYDG